MNTAQGGTASSVCYVVMLVVCLGAAYRCVGRGVLRRPHPAAIVLWLVVAVPSLLQIVVPAVFSALSRKPGLIEDGQVWRLVTSMTVQDGGAVGTTFNLVVLALVVPAAFALWRPWQAIGLFLFGGVGFDLLATFVWHQAGGGNSAATFVLATATFGLLVAQHRADHGPVRMALLIASGVVLLSVGDAHGVPVLAGFAIGIFAARLMRSSGERQRPVAPVRVGAAS